MEWAAEYDCIAQFGKFLVMEGAATQEELDAIRKEAKKEVRQEQKSAWAAFRAPVDAEMEEAIAAIEALEAGAVEVTALREGLFPGRAEVHGALRQVAARHAGSESPAKATLDALSARLHAENRTRYSQHLYSDGTDAVHEVPVRPAEFAGEEWVDGRQVLQKNFEALFEAYPELVTFGEDTGKIGGVNQAMEGMHCLLYTSDAADE